MIIYTFFLPLDPGEILSSFKSQGSHMFQNCGLLSACVYGHTHRYMYTCTHIFTMKEVLSMAEAATFKNRKKRKESEGKGKREPPAPSQASAAPEAYPADPWLRLRELPGIAWAADGAAGGFWAQVWRDEGRPEACGPPATGALSLGEAVLEVGHSGAGGGRLDRGTTTQMPDRRMQGGAGQASVREGGRQEEGRRGAGVGPAQGIPGEQGAPDQGP